jgi:1,4-alpha-glucan branching enzyme
MNTRIPSIVKSLQTLSACCAILLMLSSKHGTGQVIWTEPAFPEQDDLVTLYFNSALGNGELQGVIPVYMHTGVITNQSSGPSDWQFVQTDWGVADASYVLTPLGNGIHSFDFNGLSLSEYYNLPEGTVIESLAMVFRNASGSLVGRNENGSDIFYEVSNGGFSASILSPALSSSVLELGETIELIGQTSENSDMALMINDESVANSSGTSFNYIFQGTESGQFEIVFSANNGTQEASDSASICVLPSNPITAWPPNSSQDGITYLSETSVRLQLYAPFKEHIFVVGDFNNWQLSCDYLMTPSPDLSRYWIELHNLVPGEAYRFHYHIMPDNIRVADAYSEIVLDPWNDTDIPESTFPNLLAFPSTLTSNKPVSVFQTEQAPFEWDDADFQRPGENQLIIYEILVRDFTEERSYQAILDTLDYLDRLGVNAIEFMPINEFNGNDSWGYNPTFFMALDKAYGNKYSFKTLVEACHERDIAVILDVVLNHADTPNPWLEMYWNDALSQPSADNPWFNEIAPTSESWFYDWNHESGLTQAFMKRVLSYWVDEYHVDGYRLDFSKGMTQTPGPGNAFDQNRIDLLNEYASHLWEQDPGIYMILEHWTDLPELQALAEDGFMVWGNAAHDYGEAQMGYASNFSWINYQTQGMASPQVVSYPESHDEERLMYKALSFGNGENTYQITDLNTALARMEAIQCFHIPLPGPKLLFQFEELGYDYSINTCSDGITIDESCRLSAKPVRWDYMDNPNRYRIHEVIAGLSHLKTNHPDPFSTADFEFDVNGFGKRMHLNGTNLNAVIVANFRVSELSMIPGFPHTGEWFDYFSGEAMEVTDTGSFMSFAPGEYHVFLDANITAPNTSSVPVGFGEKGVQFDIFPNPTSQLLHGVVELHNMQPYTLRLLNTRGITLIEKQIVPWQLGRNEFSIEVEDLANGLYFIQCDQGDYSIIRKVIVN